MRDAFGIKEDFPEGSSFKEEHQKQRREAEKLEREAKYKEKEKQRRRWKFDFLKFIVIKVKVKPTGNLSTLYPTLRMLENQTVQWRSGFGKHVKYLKLKRLPLYWKYTSLVD